MVKSILPEPHESGNDRPGANLLPHDMSGRSERRADARTTTVLQIGKLVTGRQQMLCLVRNISTGGAKVYAMRSLAVGERLRVEFRSGAIAEGAVMWAEGNMAGIRFDHAIDAARLLGTGDGKMSDDKLPRNPSLDIRADAVVEWEEGKFPAEIFNISQTGVCIELEHAPLVHQSVSLKIEGLPSTLARVVWKKGNRVGLVFSQSLAYDTLGLWVMDRPARTLLG
ncbi:MULTISPECIES: PilZ domain-containing protein [unclassified Sphingobium]|uniref:PilZ domain-containing protein n=1 Tax=unclassified Sphingobium TaxID=2611147 RepID=UPI000D17111E|nr:MULTISPECIES: PilZ domain-containing protein [unclassified Sphingobium]MBG6119452.1 hypothetical protein [Sphingobium sp. JAI105]PSO09661.1 hypothetical protein C7E20_21380 [Sphingobium sp. AEW4]TWC96941.1 PilZ domain-containing protein [Sphingobium sp. AEW010]TWD16466.1 PilZ domain-containing protein [Sphingobium sp. AEW013]TWD19857.1 PilZ domain-containing protein [Sphingobium sp. AEW001]